jgi:hypothetical protein
MPLHPRKQQNHRQYVITLMTHSKSNYQIYVNIKFSYWGPLVWLILSALTATGDQRRSVDFKTINQSINHNFTTARGRTNKPTNQSTNQSQIDYFCWDALRLDAPGHPTPKVQYCCLLVIKIFLDKMWGKNQILVKIGNLLAVDLNKSVKYASFISRKCPRPRTGAR